MTDLVQRIHEWQADDEQGYDAAIGLLCDAADRLEALEKALVTARTALEQVEWVFWHPDMAPKCPWCGGRKGGNKRDGHKPDCKRQQALTEAAGVLDS